MKLPLYLESLPLEVFIIRPAENRNAAARAKLAAVGLTKYCDFNLLNLANDDRAKYTFEVRILPSSLDARPIIAAASLFAALLHWCIEPAGSVRQVPDDLRALIAALPLPPGAGASWNL